MIKVIFQKVTNNRLIFNI